MSIFNFNSKNKAEKTKSNNAFDQLTSEQKEQVIKLEFQQKVDDALKEVVPEIIMKYYGEFNHDLYERFVVDIQEKGIKKKDKDERVQKLIDYLVMRETKYQLNKAKESSDSKNTDVIDINDMDDVANGTV